MTDYTRPELTKDEYRRAQDDAGKLFRKYGMRNVGNMLLALCIENMRLVKEINEHRAVRDIEPLPTFEV
jgi:hypothetical protein